MKEKHIANGKYAFKSANEDNIYYSFTKIITFFSVSRELATIKKIFKFREARPCNPQNFLMYSQMSICLFKQTNDASINETHL